MTSISQNNDVHAQLVSVFNDVFGLDFPPERKDITPDDVRDWDSISQLRLIMEVEAVFGVSIADDEAIRIQCLQDIETLLKNRATAN